MREMRALLCLELRSLYGINIFRHTRDKKLKNRCYLIGCVFVMLIAMAFSYVGGLVYGLFALNMGHIVPAYLCVIASVLILAFGIFTAGNRIFGQKGYDLVASLPVKPGAIVLSRFGAMYVENMVLTLVIFLPGCGVYAYLQRPGIGFYFIALVGALFLPAIPMVLSTVLGTLVMAVSSRMKSKAMVQTALMILVVVVILIFSFNLEGLLGDVTADMLADLARTVQNMIEKVYPPALWLGDAMVNLHVSSLLLFVAVCAAAIAVTVAVAAGCFGSVMRRLSGISAKHNYKIGTMESRGLFKALYIREAKRYFASSIYVTNTAVGPIMAVIAAIWLCVAGLEPIQAVMPGADIVGLVPFALAAVFCIMPTSCTSISMEGKHFWVIKSLPIPTKVLLDSKIALNLSLLLPFYVVSVIALAIAMEPCIAGLLWLVLLPAEIMVFTVVLGITINLKFHSFDWDKEEYVVKQSLPAGLGGFAGFFISAGLGIAVFLLPPQLADAGKALIALLLLVATALLYRKNNRAVLQSL